MGPHRQPRAEDVAPPLLEKLLSGDDIEVIVGLVKCLRGYVQVNLHLGRDLVTGNLYSCVSVSTMWTSGGLVTADTTR